MGLVTILSLAFFVTLTGCSALPFGEPTPQGEPAPVKIVNNESFTETFEVAVVEVGANITIMWRDNQSETHSGNITINQGSSGYHKGGLYRVELADSARHHGRYTLDPGESKVLSVENVAPDEAIVVLVYDEPEGEYRSINSLNCGGLSIVGYKVSPESGGPDDWTPSAHQCA